MSLDATVKGESSNSYVTEEEATTLLANRLYTDTWDAATSADHKKALIWATQILDRVMDWRGTPRTIEQALRWPRSGVLTIDEHKFYDYDLIPDLLKTAVAEFAQVLLSRDRTIEPEILGQGIKDVTIGPMKVSIDPHMMLNAVPDYIVNMLGPLGDPLPLAGPGSSVTKLERA